MPLRLVMLTYGKAAILEVGEVVVGEWSWLPPGASASRRSRLSRIFAHRRTKFSPKLPKAKNTQQKGTPVQSALLFPE